MPDGHAYEGRGSRRANAWFGRLHCHSGRNIETAIVPFVAVEARCAREDVVSIENAPTRHESWTNSA
jgi:hypothetical protein